MPVQCRSQRELSGDKHLRYREVQIGHFRELDRGRFLRTETCNRLGPAQQDRRGLRARPGIYLGAGRVRRLVGSLCFSDCCILSMPNVRRVSSLRSIWSNGVVVGLVDRNLLYRIYNRLPEANLIHSFTKYEIDSILSLVEALLPGLLFRLYAALYIYIAATYCVKVADLNNACNWLQCSKSVICHD